MTFSKDVARRAPVVAEAVVSLADLTSGVALPVFDIPSGAVIDELYGHLEQVFNSTTSDSIKIGDGTDDDRFLAATNVTTGQALGYKAGAATGRGYKLSSGDTIDLVWTSGGGTPTTGRIRLVCRYYMTGQADYVQR